VVDAYATDTPLRVLHRASAGGARSSVPAWALSELPTGEAELDQLAFRDGEGSELVPAAPGRTFGKLAPSPDAPEITRNQGQEIRGRVQIPYFTFHFIVAFSSTSGSFLGVLTRALLRTSSPAPTRCQRFASTAEL